MEVSSDLIVQKHVDDSVYCSRPYNYFLIIFVFKLSKFLTYWSVSLIQITLKLIVQF